MKPNNHLTVRQCALIVERTAAAYVAAQTAAIRYVLDTPDFLYSSEESRRLASLEEALRRQLDAANADLIVAKEADVRKLYEEM